MRTLNERKEVTVCLGIPWLQMAFSKESTLSLAETVLEGCVLWGINLSPVIIFLHVKLTLLHFISICHSWHIFLETRAEDLLLRQFHCNHMLAAWFLDLLYRILNKIWFVESFFHLFLAYKKLSLTDLLTQQGILSTERGQRALMAFDSYDRSIIAVNIFIYSMKVILCSLKWFYFFEIMCIILCMCFGLMVVCY